MSTFAKIETANLGERVAELLRTAIIQGRLAGGQPLRDRAIAEEMGVSRTPVREALHKLQSEGLTEPRGRSGWVVTDFTVQDVHELFQLRILLEPEGLRVLEKSPDPAKIEELATYFSSFSHPIPLESHPFYFQQDDDFHMALVRCSGNARLISYYELLKVHINRGRYILSGSSVERMEETLDEHRAVIDAMLAGDFAQARNALVQHLRTGEELMAQRVVNRTTE